MIYYVSVDGNDLHDGSYNTPFLNIGKAVSVCTNGDIIQFFPGTHILTSVININKSIVISKVAGTVILSSNYTIFRIQNDVTIELITFQSDNESPLIVVDSNYVSIQNYISIHNCIFNYVKYAIFLKCKFDIQNNEFNRLSGNTIHSIVIQIYNFGDQSILSGNTFTDNGNVDNFIKLIKNNDSSSSSDRSIICTHNTVNYSGNYGSVFFYNNYYGSYPSYNNKMSITISYNNMESITHNSKFVEFEIDNDNNFDSLNKIIINGNSISSTDYGILHLNKSITGIINIPSDILLRAIFKIYGNTSNTISVGPTGPSGLSITGPTGSAGLSITGSAGLSITGPTGLSITGPTGPTGLSITGPTGPDVGLVNSLNHLIDCGYNVNNSIYIGPGSINSISNNSGNSITIGFNAGPISSSNFYTFNTAIGNYTFNNGFVMVDNVAIGNYALNLVSGTGGIRENTAIGTNSLRYLQANEWSKNTAIGTDSGTYTETDNLNNIVNSTFIGSNTKGINNTNNSIVIGNNAVSHGSNTVTLGDSNINAWITTGSSSIVTNSDIRDKIVSDVSIDAISIIKNLKPVKFTWQPREPKNKNRNKDSGFIAQDLEEIVEKNEYIDLVDKSNPDLLQIKKDNLIPVLIKCIKEINYEYKVLKNIIGN
jgi:hypothetical protein